MELNGILTFIGIFVSILLVSIGMAYYGMLSQRDDDDILPSDASTGSTSNNKKSKKTSGNKQQHQQQQQQQQQKRDSSSKDKQKAAKSKENENKVEKIEQEEEPIVIIPDPFTKQINSRFAPQLKNANNNGNNVAIKKEPIEKRSATTVQSSSNQVQSIGSAHLNALKKEESNNNLGATQSLSNGYLKFTGFSGLGNGSSVVDGSHKIFEKTNVDKVRPRATVKPNQAIRETQQSSNKPTNLVVKQQQQQQQQQQQPPASKMLLKPVANQFETNGLSNEKDRLKIQELTESLNEKLRQCESLNATNMKLQGEVSSLNALLKDLEGLKTTNLIIQQEIHKQSTRCMVLEKERNHLDEKFKNELDVYKKNETSLIERIKMLESQKLNEKTTEINGNMERQINYLQNELSDIQKRFKESEESYLKQIKELTSHLMSSENQLKDLQRDKQGYQMKWEESIDINKRLNDHIKDIDAKLSSSLCLINELKMNENHFEAQNKLLQAKQEAELSSLRDNLESKNRDIENLKNLNRSLIEKLEIAKQQQQQQNGNISNSNGHQENGKSDDLLREQMEQLREKETEIKKLGNKLSESAETTKKLEQQNKSLNEQLDSFEKKVKDLEKQAEKFQKTIDDSVQKKNEDDSSSKELEKRIGDLKSELDKEKKSAQELKAKLSAEQKLVAELNTKLSSSTADEVDVKALQSEIDRLRAKNSKLKSLLESTDSSMESLQQTIESSEAQLIEEISIQKSLVADLKNKNSELESKSAHELAELKEKLAKEVGIRKELESKLNTTSTSNGHPVTNGNKAVNGNGYHHHHDDDEDVESLRAELAKLKAENDSLRHIIDEETKSGKLADRSLLRNIIKKGQEAFEKEKIVIERYEEKLEGQ